MISRRKSWIIGLGATVGAFMTVVGALEYFGYEVDRPAWASEVEAIRDLTVSTRAILLNDKWTQTYEKLEGVQRQIDRDPSNEFLPIIENQLERQLRDIERQQKELDRIMEGK